MKTIVHESKALHTGVYRVTKSQTVICHTSKSNTKVCGVVVGIDHRAKLVSVKLDNESDYAKYVNGDIARERGFVEIPARYIYDVIK